MRPRGEQFFLGDVSFASIMSGRQPRTTCPITRTFEPMTQKRLGLKKNFGWALFGNLVYQAAQWLSLVLIAKLMTAQDVGQFAFALAVCTPITAFSQLNLRTVQVTDVKQQYNFGHFLGLQLIASCLAMLCISAIAGFHHDDLSLLWLIIIVGLGQAVIAVREVYNAYNQKLERMDTVAFSKVLLGVGSLASLGLVLWWTRNLVWAVAAAQVAKLAVLLGYDLRATAKLATAYAAEVAERHLRPIWCVRTMLALSWIALPLGFASVLQALHMNMPRYYIAGFLDDERLGYYAAIFALVMAAKQVIKAAGLSTLPRLSRYYQDNRRAFLRLLLKLIGLGGVLGCCGCLVAVLAGKPVLRVMFTPAYADYNNVFIWAMCYGVMDFMLSFLNYGVLATRRFRLLPLANLTALVVVAVAGVLLVPRYELIGAVGSLMCGRLGFGLVALCILIVALRQQARQESDTESATPHADRPFIDTP